MLRSILSVLLLVMYSSVDILWWQQKQQQPWVTAGETWTCKSWHPPCCADVLSLWGTNSYWLLEGRKGTKLDFRIPFLAHSVGGWWLSLPSNNFKEEDRQQRMSIWWHNKWEGKECGFYVITRPHFVFLYQTGLESLLILYEIKKIISKPPTLYDKIQFIAKRNIK